MNTYGYLILLILILSVVYELVIEVINLNYIEKTHKNPPEETFKYYNYETLKKSAKYYKAKSTVSIYENILHYIIFFILLIFGVFQYFSQEISHSFTNEYMRAIIYFTLYQLFFALLNLPFNIYQTFKLEKKYNFNRATPAIFIKDLIINAILSTVIMSIILCIVIVFIKTCGTNWYIYAALGVVIFYLLLMYIYPVFIAPLFNKFEPLKNKKLENKIFTLAKKAGFSVKSIFQMDASKRSSHSNAFFAGFGKNRRIVLFDTLLQNHTDEEILAILAHEIGHYKRKHIQKSIIFMIIMTFLFFYIAGILINTNFIYTALGFEKTIFTGLFIISIILSPLGIIIKPIFLYLSRKHEFEADKFALSLINNLEIMQDTLIKLHKDNLAYPLPHPLYVKMQYSHPPLIERIEKLIT